MKSFLLVFVIIFYLLGGLGVSAFRIIPALGGWFSMTMSVEEARIEKRRLIIILLLNCMLYHFNKQLLGNFSWLYFILVSLVSISAIFFIFKLEVKAFHSIFSNKVKVKPSIKKISDKTSSCSEREKNINSVFSESLYNLLRKHNYIFLDENCTYEEVKTIAIKSEQRVFRFKNYRETKYFYDKVLKYSKARIEDYTVILGYKENTLGKGIPKDCKFSEEFEAFLKELKEVE